ncbi:MAG: hypothetical protein WBR26_13940 [Candidatus Acidiferrum sp.]
MALRKGGQETGWPRQVTDGAGAFADWDAGFADLVVSDNYPWP